MATNNAREKRGVAASEHLATSCRGGLFAFFDRRSTEHLLGATLPKNASDVHYLSRQPSGDLAYREALVRFDASSEDYRAFVQACGLTPYSVSGLVYAVIVDTGHRLSAPGSQA